MTLIIPSKEKNQKSWILKIVYGKHSIYFSDLKKKVFLSDKVPRFFILRQSACNPPKNIVKSPESGSGGSGVYIMNC